jgi:hypothetical protein
VEKASVWEVIANSPPEFWCGVAVGAIVDKIMRAYRAQKKLDKAKDDPKTSEADD